MTDLTFGKISNGHISARGRPIHFMFGSTLGFSGSADRVALFPVSPNPRWLLGHHLKKFKWPTDDRRRNNDRPHIWENFKWPYLREASSDPLHVWFYVGVFGIGGSSSVVSGFAKSKMAARPPSWKIQMAIVLRGGSSDLLRVWF